MLEINAWRRARQDRPLVSYQELCRELARAGPGTFGDLDTEGARSVLRRYSDAWFATVKRRNEGDRTARFPRRRRALMPLRWYHGTFILEGRRLRIPVARGRPPLWVRLDRHLPYPLEQVRSVTLVYDAGRLWLDVTAEVPVACYPAGQEPDPARIAGVDLGVIHPYAVAGATATFRRRPISPPDSAAAPRRPSRPASRTAAPGRTCPVSPPRDVTHAAAPITAAPAGPLAGTGPPRHPLKHRQGVARHPARSLQFHPSNCRQVH